MTKELLTANNTSHLAENLALIGKHNLNCLLSFDSRFVLRMFQMNAEGHILRKVSQFLCRWRRLWQLEASTSPTWRTSSTTTCPSPSTSTSTGESQGT